MLPGTHASLIQDLQARIGRMETAGRNAKFGQGISSGFPALDRLLPGGGLAKGSLVEWFGDGSGALTLALAVAGSIARHGGVLVIIAQDTFFPPAAAALGAPLERTVVIDPGDLRLALWTWEQSLRCEGVAVTLGRLGRVGDVTMRRLQLAAAAGGGLGFLIRPSGCQAETSWAEARLLVKAQQPGTPGPEGRGEGGQDPSRNLGPFAGANPLTPNPSPPEYRGRGEQQPGCFGAAGLLDPTWRLEVELTRCRGGFGGGTALVEIPHETNDVPLASQLADPARAD